MNVRDIVIVSALKKDINMNYSYFVFASDICK